MSEYTCTLDADGWQLYSSDESIAAAKALSESLTLAVSEAKAKLGSEPMLSEHKLAEGIRNSMYTLMRRFSDTGASDTEPQCVLVAELETAFGLDEYSLDR